MQPFGVRVTGEDLAALTAFYAGLGFVGEGPMFDARGHALFLEKSPEPAGAELVWPGQVSVFYDLEGNQHRRAPAVSARVLGTAEIVGVLYGVVDLVESSEWYQRQLGMALAFYDVDSDWIELTSRGLSVLLSFLPGEQRRGVLVLATKDAPAEVARQQERGLIPLWTRSTAWARLALFADPAGNPVLFMERSGSG